MTLNYFNYFTEIEEHFVRKRGKNLLISPLDWCLIELWKENGIPLNVVLRGIDRSFASAQQRRKRSPKTLFYCHPAVIEAFEEYQEAMLGESAIPAEDESGLSKDAVLSFLNGVQRQLASRDGEAFDRAIARISALTSEVSGRAKPDLREVDAELAEIATMLTEALQDELDDETWQRILKDSRQELKIYKKHLAPDMFERLRQKQIERRLIEHFNLPEFSLLHYE